MIGPGAPKSALATVCSGSFCAQRVDAVLALVVGDERDLLLLVLVAAATTGDTLPPSASVYCFSSPFFRLSVQML